MSTDRLRPSPALLVAVIALVAALAGSAVALPGKNKVDKNDIQKGAVTKKAIKKGAVTKKAIAKGAVAKKGLKDGSVTEPALGAASVTEAKIAPHESVHLVGQPGEPAFGNGGDGDCIWQNPPPALGITGLAPVGFYKDQLGNVRMQGIALPVDGPGGDGVCDPTDPGEAADGIVFTLPDGYAPVTLALGIGSVDVTVVVPKTGATIPPGIALPPGVVYAQGTAFLDEIKYQPAG